MSQTNLTLRYLNEDDRAYGLAGMVISLAHLNAINRVAAISLDADGPMVEFSHEYYFCGSPSISPKATWDNLVSNLHLTTSMVVSNLLARSLVRLKEEAPGELFNEIYSEVEKEGIDTCALEADEVKTLYNNALSRSVRIFRNPRVHPAIDELAHILSIKRSLSGREIFDELRLLELI